MTSFSLFKTLALAGLLSTALTAPVVEKRQSATSDAAQIPNATPPAGSSGSLRGSLDLGGYSSSNDAGLPKDDSTQIPSSEYQLAPGQDVDADIGLYFDLSTVENPQPIRGSPDDSPTDPGPRMFLAPFSCHTPSANPCVTGNTAIDRQNPDIFAPPGTDAGGVPQSKWPMSLSHNRHGLKGAGWARQQTVVQLPIATAMAGVDMRLEPNAYRELHWHKANEWALILNGTVRLNAVNEAGETFVDDLGPGDVWFFPSGIPHSIQAFESGCEFLLVFDDGSFSEDNTFLVSELFERNPKSVLAKDLRVDTSAFDNIPDGELYVSRHAQLGKVVFLRGMY